MKNRTVEASRNQPGGALLIVQIAAFVWFASHALHYKVTGETPLQILSAHDALRPQVEEIGIFTWQEWTDMFSGWDKYVSTSLAYILIAVAAASFFVGHKYRHRTANAFVGVGAALLFLHAVCVTIAPGFDATRLTLLFTQTALLMTGPALLLAATRGWGHGSGVGLFIRIIVAITLVAHGLLALQIIPPPAEWPELFTLTFSTSPETSALLLRITGVLEFLAAIAILLPWRVISTYGLWFCAGWGLIAAISWPIAHLEKAEKAYGMDPWFWETLFRLPYGLLPLALVFAWEAIEKRKRMPEPELQEDAVEDQAEEEKKDESPEIKEAMEQETPQKAGISAATTETSRDEKEDVPTAEDSSSEKVVETPRTEEKAERPTLFEELAAEVAAQTQPQEEELPEEEDVEEASPLSTPDEGQSEGVTGESESEDKGESVPDSENIPIPSSRISSYSRRGLPTRGRKKPIKKQKGDKSNSRKRSGPSQRRRF